LDTLAIQTRVAFKNIPRIVEFLNTLNDDKYDRRIPDAVPSGLSVGGNIK
jgi:cytochrome c peroxidase